MTSWQVVSQIDVRDVTIISCIVHQVTTLVMQESGLSTLPRPRICIQLLYSHFTALMYIDLTAIQHLPVPYYRPFTVEV